MIQKILVPLDGSALAEYAAQYAAALAGKFEGRLILLRIAASDDFVGQAGDYLEAAEQAEVLSSVEVLGIVRIGNAVKEILRVAQDEQPDLVVMSSHGRTGLEKAVFGSVAEAVVKGCTRPVLVVRPTSGFEGFPCTAPLRP